MSASTPPTPRLAATVMLVREGPDGLEVFMMQRASSMAFAPSMHVFPGGGVDPGDAADLTWLGPDEQTWARRLSTDAATARALLAAAVRELAEETGVLLASPVAGGEEDEGSGAAPSDLAAAPASDAPEALRADDRSELVAHAVSLAGLLRRRGWGLRSDLLTYRGHWITPEAMPRRYDTRFFLAEVPAGQEPDGATDEAVAAGWVRPADVLDRGARGEVALMPPTRAMLTDLLGPSTVAQAREQQVDLATVLPTLLDATEKVTENVTADATLGATKDTTKSAPGARS